MLTSRKNNPHSINGSLARQKSFRPIMDICAVGFIHFHDEPYLEELSMY